jgi:predicted DCC family thiol-disulfide oxidoreductase YuxK
MNTSDAILLFDDVCNLCNSMVFFIIKRDPDKKIRFVPLKSPLGDAFLKELNPDANPIDSVVYIRKDKYYYKSSALLHLLKDIGNGWSLLYGFILVPVFIRDFFYDLIARSRYRIFGRTKKCSYKSLLP